MTYRTVSTFAVGHQPVANTDTVQNHPVGTIMQAWDPTYGSAEFIYLLGVASTEVGSLVTYNATDGQTTLAVPGAGITLPVAVAMSANVASQYGWYQISGLARAHIASATSAAAGIAIGSSAGTVIAAATSNEIQGAVTAAVSSATSGTDAGFITVLLQRPIMSDV